LKVRKVLVSGVLPKGVFAKDVILKIIQTLGVNGGIGYAYEYSGDVFANMSMEARMTVCNMSIEGGARIGYINPDQVTFDYLKNRMYAPKGDEYDRAVHYWKSVASDSHAVYDDVVRFSAKDITPMITWGINPAQAISIDGVLPKLDLVSDSDRKAMELAYSYMKLTPGKPILGTPVDVVFIGSCTNGRIEDLRLAASVLKGKKVKIKCLVVPGSYQVKAQAEAEGLDDIFKSAGALWRFPGCSMCLAMNPDKLVETQISASTSNRNFMGRQGSPTGRTMLVSPVSAAAIAIEGKVADPRSYL